jgi:transcriptional regulator with XRE-family HTH domain
MSASEIGEANPNLFRSSEMPAESQTTQDARPNTVKDVARLAGVSSATVSRVVNGASNVSTRTRKRVMTVVSQLQYSPNAHAAELGRANGGISRKRGV